MDLLHVLGLMINLRHLDCEIQCSYEVFWEEAIMCLYLGLHVLSFENH